MKSRHLLIEDRIHPDHEARYRCSFISGALAAGGAIIGAVGSIAAANAQSSAAKKAAALQHDATLASIAEQRRQFDTTRSDFGPYRETGYAALGALADLFLPGGANVLGIAVPGRPGTGAAPPRTISQQTGVMGGKRLVDAAGNPVDLSGYTGIWADPMTWVNKNPHLYRIEDTTVPQFQDVPNPAYAAYQEALAGEEAGGAGPDYSNFFKSPGYQFQLDEGIKALKRASAAGGRLYSGRTEREILRYGEGLAAGSFNDYVARLASLAGVGQSATQSTAAFGANAANAISNALATGARNQGSALMAAGTARASGYTGAANALNSGIQNYLFLNAYNRRTGALGGNGILNVNALS